MMPTSASAVQIPDTSGFETEALKKVIENIFIRLTWIARFLS